jgi:hypothetical protein
LNVTDDGSDITFLFSLAGAGVAGDDVFILYLDTGAGGFADTSTFDDTGGGTDRIRKGISGYDGSDRATVNFSDFTPEYAIGADLGFIDIWQLQGTGSHLYGGDIGINRSSSGTFPTSYSISITMADIGIGQGETVAFAATYLNGSNGFRSDEAIAQSSTGLDAGNPGTPSSITLGSWTYTTIPEPATMAMVVLGVVGILAFRRK